MIGKEEMRNELRRLCKEDAERRGIIIPYEMTLYDYVVAYSAGIDRTFLEMLLQAMKDYPTTIEADREKQQKNIRMVEALLA